MPNKRIDDYMRTAEDEGDTQIKEEIESLIRNESDPRWRTALLIMQNMNNAIIAASRLTRAMASRLAEHHTDVISLSTDFKTHVDEEMKMINRGVGGWKVLTWAGGIIGTVLVSMFLYIFSTTMSQWSDVAKSAQASQRDNIEFRGRLELLFRLREEDAKKLDALRPK